MLIFSVERNLISSKGLIRMSFLQGRLQGIAARLFDLECEMENLRTKLDELHDEQKILQCQTQDLCVLEKPGFMRLDGYVLVKTPYELKAYDEGQFDKIEPSLEDLEDQTP